MKFADVIFENNEYPRYRALTTEAEKQIRALLADLEIQPDISARTKTIGSINDKIERKKYAEFTREMLDISAVRVVCMTARQKGRVVDILKQRFRVVAHEQASSDPYSMGYVDEKLILLFGSNFPEPRYAGIRDLPFEVQIRFVFMDAWAKFSHAFSYTMERSIPPELLRKIHIMGAMAEMLDELANNYADRIDDVQNAAKSDFPHKLADVPINMETLQAYIEYMYPGKPIKRKIQDLIIRDINNERYRSIADIDRALKAADDFLAWYSKIRPELFEGGADYITKGLGWTDKEFRERHAFGTTTRRAFEQFSARQRT